MSKLSNTDDKKNVTSLLSDENDGENGSGPISSDLPNAPFIISTMTVAALKAQLDANFIKYKSKTEKAALATLLVETIEARVSVSERLPSESETEIGRDVEAERR
ncbi:hypothetical protein TrVE_jg6538 [Triparma verrucosa]|uniref:Uncharacterized protein n=1 Tax=Triparma verrucosa TaxID=1606542 RepID=A0A9W7KU69_9STRA|nr:hypothetical protein TrVE_jg6538 [Triparma verrucosa]